MSPIQCDINMIFLDLSTYWYHSVWRLEVAPVEHLIHFCGAVIFEHKHYNSNENHFVNFTGVTFALGTHVYTSMHKGRSHQQVCRAT